jgi:hypothetical protein
MNDDRFFQFETDFVENLRCIPMQVRMKLDTCGVKLKLADWNRFDRSERLKLVELPCKKESEIQAYKDWLQNLVRSKTGSPAKELNVDPQPPWLDSDRIPDEVRQQANDRGVSIFLQQWQQLSPLQRFALIKLSRPSHENHNLLPALKEFKIT